MNRLITKIIVTFLTLYGSKPYADSSKHRVRPTHRFFRDVRRTHPTLEITISPVGTHRREKSYFLKK